MADSINQKISRFYSLISNYQEEAPDTRYKSWEWCHQKFCLLRNEYVNSSHKKKKKMLICYLYIWHFI